ncbi:unnamed protein product [Musa acuminata subsp. malaccensis]|uniref:(wild Malaysian banana) hypothetical protein n=1 Tax=Musa acuminata subsp. malaccensis TaxID=214687 RepID=A0A804KR14_MUSAM|nr:PREDICTED: BEL1-like homeodomain protein 2 [Musa acuminata subsp. malaccensis]XP_018676814.1 PREDICTED: BEL1-like homeodomain protein 2 [Musa acuminata subsp. malaccensis]CAG1852092.1 unnamed protein product [Musa acuminata subsp. malaccensis]
MENDVFNGSLPIFNHGHMIVDPVSSYMLSGPLVQSGLPDHNSNRQILAGNPMVSTLQEEAIDSIYLTKSGVMACSDVSFSRNIPRIGNDSVNGPIGNVGLREHLPETSLSAASVANLYSSTNYLVENIIKVGTASTLDLPSEEMTVPASTDIHNSHNSSLSASPHCNFGTQHDLSLLAPKNGTIGCMWNQNELLDHQVLLSKTFSVVRPSYHVTGSSQPGWNFYEYESNWNFNHPCGNTARAPGSELSLSLGSCQPSVTDMGNNGDQCSELSCSAVTQVASADSVRPPTEFQACNHAIQNPVQDFRSGMTQRETIPCTEKPSFYQGCSLVQLSHMLLGSKYLQAVEEVLSEIATYAVEDLQRVDDSPDEKMSISSSCSTVRELPISVSGELLLSFGDTEPLAGMDSQKFQEANRKKTELLSMLQLVDHGYNRCLDQIQNVITSFICISQSGTSETHARFALRTISALYKSLRKRITSQILFISQQPSTEPMKEKERSFESSLLQKQWALQQLRKSDHQSWRPQRGLPEKSVSVLRAWMFENFLHPYPKDNDKHVLAVKSGLTRSQVSNWFINARVRLWKPMIEEMYAELNKKQ